MLCGVGGALDRAALVAALKAVQGVADADVDPDAQGGLGTLRLDLEAGVDESAVASRVSQVLREQFGLGVDADRVELVEVAPRQDAPTPLTIPEAKPDLAVVKKVDVPPADEPPVARAAAEAAGVEQVAEQRSLTLPLPRASHRPSIAKIHLVSEGLDVTASVTLAGAGRLAVGEARGLASQSGVHKAVAVATLRAVGTTPVQTAGIVYAQSAVAAVTGLVFGIPLGIAVGRTVWRLVAESTPLLYVPPTAWWAVLAVVPAAALSAAVFAVLPAARAARGQVAAVLRTE